MYDLEAKLYSKADSLKALTTSQERKSPNLKDEKLERHNKMNLEKVVGRIK